MVKDNARCGSLGATNRETFGSTVSHIFPGLPRTNTSLKLPSTDLIKTDWQLLAKFGLSKSSLIGALWCVTPMQVMSSGAPHLQLETNPLSIFLGHLSTNSDHYVSGGCYSTLLPLQIPDATHYEVVRFSMYDSITMSPSLFGQTRSMPLPVTLLINDFVSGTRHLNIYLTISSD